MQLIEPTPEPEPEGSAIEWLVLGELEIDTSYQRVPDPGKVAAIAANFDWDKFGILCVSHRGGRKFIVDGGHRHSAAMLKGYAQRKVACEAFHGLSQAQEAALFGGRNDTRTPTQLVKFKARIVEGEPRAVAIEKTLNRHGYFVGAGHVSCISALDWVYGGSVERGKVRPIHEAELFDTFALLAAAWPDNQDAVQAAIVKGIGKLLINYGAKVDRERLCRAMATYRGGPTGLLSEAKVAGATVFDGVADRLVKSYNKRLSEANQLPPWR